ncbi:hypothetical protein ACFQ60_36690 [Streptomyces zhihengii]
MLSAPVLAAVESAATQAAVADDARRLGDETVTLLTRAGFARHFVPRAWGGPEGTFESLLTAAAAVGRDAPRRHGARSCGPPTAGSRPTCRPRASGNCGPTARTSGSAPRSGRPAGRAGCREAGG